MSNFIRNAFLPSLEILLFLLVFYMSLFFMPDMLNSDGDLGRHITVGNYILDTRTVPSQDVFSHTRYGERLVLHEWLSEVIYALAHRAAGLNGVAWLTALLLAFIYAALAVGLRGLGVSAPVAFLAALAAYFTGMIHHLPRPHLFTLLLFTLFILVLERYRRRSATAQAADTGNTILPPRVNGLLRNATLRSLAALFIIVLLWANLNGAFVLAFFILVIYIAGAILDRQPRRALVFLSFLAVSFLASLLNPYGLTLPRYVFGFMGNRFLVDNTVEYLSPNFHNVSAWFFAAWILFSIVLLGRFKQEVKWTPLLLLGAWTAFGLYSARNITNYAQVAAIVTAPVAEQWVISVLPALRVRFRNLDSLAPATGGWLSGLVVVALLILLQANGTTFDARGEGNQFTTRAFPVDAVDFLERTPPQGNMFNEYTWGGYIEYRMFPAQRVFIDGNNDFFGEALVREYLVVINAQPGWEEILKRYNVDWVIVPPDRPLARELSALAGWRQVYRGEDAGVWIRD